MHVITTVRRKQEYEIIKENGKSQVVKLGTKEITREGFEYELTVNFEIVNEDHYAKATKDRTDLFDKKSFIITEQIGKELIEFAKKGANAVEETIKSLKVIKSRQELEVFWNNLRASLKTNDKVIASFKEMGAKYPKPPKDETNEKALN